jgi:4-aminobutyrate aminotransferase-like enzyme
MTAAVTASDPYAASRTLYERASASLAGGVSTAFRVYEQPVPLFLREAHGAYLVDVDGRGYVDYVCGFGPVILGHGHERVAAAVGAAARDLQQVGGQHEAEVELAELLCATVPAFELVRLSMSGSEAIHAAVRLARGVTDRPRRPMRAPRCRSRTASCRRRSRRSSSATGTTRMASTGCSARWATASPPSSWRRSRATRA